LTTPVAYITSTDAMEDIFRFAHNFPSRLARQVMYLPSAYYAGAYGAAAPATVAAQNNRYGLYSLRSAGPDTYYQNHLNMKGDYDAGGWNQASYDATNGTVSAGDIYRSQKAPGETHI